MISGVVYVNQGAHNIFYESATYISHVLKVPVYTPSTLPKRENAVFIVFGIHDFLFTFETIQNEIPTIRYIILQSEQLSSKYFKNAQYLSMLKKNIVYSWSPFVADKLDIPYEGVFEFRFLPPEPRLLRRKRTVDLFFCGSPTPYREKILKKIQTRFPRANCVFEFSWKYTDYHKLTEVLTRTKCVLNIPCFANSSLETHRVNKALSCGCHVISYYSADPKLNAQYQEHIYLTDNLEETVSRFLSKTLPERNCVIPRKIPQHHYLF